MGAQDAEPREQPGSIRCRFAHVLHGSQQRCEMCVREFGREPLERPGVGKRTHLRLLVGAVGERRERVRCGPVDDRRGEAADAARLVEAEVAGQRHHAPVQRRPRRLTWERARLARIGGGGQRRP